MLREVGGPAQMTTRSVLIQYWHEKDPPESVVATLASSREHNPGLGQRVFDEASAAELIAASHGSREVAAFRSCAIPAMQADYFRYCAVHALGGVYADANFRCLGSLEWLIDGPEAGTFFGRQDPVPSDLAAVYNWRRPVGPFRAITNSLFGLRERRHPLLALAVQASTANLEHRVAHGPIGVWVTTGPGVLTSLYLLRRLGSIDAFLEYSHGSVIEKSAPLLCEVVDDYARIDSIWDGVEIRPLGERETWATKENRELGSAHWDSVRGSIYREDDGR